MLSNLLMDPRIAGVDVDSEERIERHREILLSKKMIREVFEEHYREVLRLEKELIAPYEGVRVEIGAGSSILKTIDPSILASDVVAHDGHDLVVDAQDMPFGDGEVRTVFGIHCFHHLPNPYRFLEELARVTRPGGGAILIEPYYGPAASALYKHLFANEDFDKKAAAVRPAQGPMSDANQALSYIVFEREKLELARRFPMLDIVHRKPLHNYVRYLVSGGINFRQLLPSVTIPLLKGVEALLTPLDRLFALHHVIVIRRNALATAPRGAGGLSEDETESPARQNADEEGKPERLEQVD